MGNKVYFLELSNIHLTLFYRKQTVIKSFSPIKLSQEQKLSVQFKYFYQYSIKLLLILYIRYLELF